MQRFNRWASVGLGCYPLSRNMCERNWWEQFDMTQKESSEWRQPKSSVFDYFDRLIIQGKKRSSWWQHCALRRRLQRGPRAALRWPQTQSQKKNPSRRLRLRLGLDSGAIVQTLAVAQRSFASAITPLTIVYGSHRLQKITKHLQVFGEHWCGLHSGLVETVGTAAWSLKWI